ncbi:MAG: general secretion pathway protein GspB [Woeseiaceae bacterium]
MSFILDALKKSETERQNQGTAEFANVPSSAGGPRAPRWLWPITALLAVNILVLLGLWMREETSSDDPSRGALSQTAQQLDTDTSFAERIAQARISQPARRMDNAAVPLEDAVTPVSGSPAPAAAVQILSSANQLRVNGTLQMAELHLDIHVYSDAPADRFVFINMAKHRENSRLVEGPLVKEITREGVILSYQGTDFLLPRE